MASDLGTIHSASMFLELHGEDAVPDALRLPRPNGAAHALDERGAVAVGYLLGAPIYADELAYFIEPVRDAETVPGGVRAASGQKLPRHRAPSAAA